MGKRVNVNEPRRTICFENGQRLDLHNVVAYDPSGTMLRIWSDEGLTFINPSKVLWHMCHQSRKDEQ